MPSFSYTARDPKGTLVRGRVEADSRRGAMRQLSGRGLVPVRLDEGAGGANGTGAATTTAKDFNWRKLLSFVGEDDGKGQVVSRLGRRERLPFLRALGELVGCGVQTADAVRMLARRLSGGPQKVLATTIWDDLSQGRSLSAALRAHPKVFDEASVSLIEAGEATGNLAEILKRLVLDLERREELKSKLTTAMAYPVFIVVIAIVVVLIFLNFLLPRIQSLLDGLGGKLPLPTLLLIEVSEFLKKGGPVILLGLVLGTVALLSWRRTKKGREVTDQQVLGIPGLGAFLRDSDLLRLAQTLALLLENGITTIAALALTERTILNTMIRRKFSEARLKISEGTAIANALRDTGYLPDLVTDILLVGESTGNIVPSLHEVSRYYQRRQEKQLGFFVSALSVGVLLFAFAFVALIATGIILAVFSLSSNLRTG